MKITLLTILVTTVSIINCMSQDIITLKTGEEIKARITEVGVTDVKYKKFDSTSSNPTYTLLKVDILLIKYENGSKDIFLNEQKQTSTDTTFNIPKDELYRMGTTDAAKYYKGYKPATLGTFFASLLLSAGVGLIPAIACSATTPNNISLNYPNDTLIKKKEYYEGYVTKAKSIKSRKVWGNWVGALIINIFAYTIYKGQK